MMNDAADVLRRHPEIAIFLAVALGYYVGRLKIGSFSLGTVAATLLIGVALGQLKIVIDPIVKTVFFDMFIFVVGYRVGPQFFRSLRGDAFPQGTLTLVLCGSVLGMACATVWLLGYDAGTAAGLVAGASTESATLGSATDAINRLNVSAEEKKAMLDSMPVAYAVTYLFGTAGVVWWLSKIGPKILGVDLAAACAELEKSMGQGSSLGEGIQSGYRPTTLRALRVENPQFAGITVAELERKFGRKLVIGRVRRASGGIVEAAPDLVINAGDVIAAGMDVTALFDESMRIGTEVHDPELLDIPVATRDIVITRKSLEGRKLAELALEYGHGVRGRRLVRLGQEVPYTPETRIERGDTLTIYGHQRDVERVAKVAGYLDEPSPVTDLSFVAVGMALGALIGLPALLVGGIEITLTTSGGILILGLIFGWLRARYPVFGRFPEPALWIFDVVGLNTFMAVVGIGAGAAFVHGLLEKGPILFLAGIAVTIVPHTVTILVGKYVFDMHPGILLGACTGAGTCTAALAAVKEEAKSKIPALGYTVPYAIGNILLTAWGPVIVALMG
jgi:putative transport protein